VTGDEGDWEMKVALVIISASRANLRGHRLGYIFLYPTSSASGTVTTGKWMSGKGIIPEIPEDQHKTGITFLNLNTML
jgi:hypothetical protein